MNTNYKFAIIRIKKEYLNQKEFKPTNKYIVLYRAMKQCILNKDLPHGWQLPSTRILAKELELSRITINKTYELLQLEKLILAKIGSGNYVNYENVINNKKDIFDGRPIDNSIYPKISKNGESYLNNISLINRLPNNNLAFRPGLPPIDIFPINPWKNLLNTYWRHIKSSGLSYSRATGLESLKKNISNYLNISRNIKCSHEQIVIVSGSLQSLFLVANVLIDRSDYVALENPTFPNVHSIFKSSLANLLPIELDKEGLRIDHLKNVNHLKPKIVHVTPSNHYPTGIKMSLKRRKELLQWASEHKALIIENDYENEVANNINTLPSIFSLDTEDRTIYMGTFNRLLHPSIRLGYMVVPKYLTSVVEALQEHSHRFVDPSVQMVMNQFIERNYLYEHIKNVIKVAKERYTLFLSEFEDGNEIMTIENKDFLSLHVVAKFKKEINEKEESRLVQRLLENNIVVFPLSKCYIGNEKQFGLILGYSAVMPNILKRKLKQLKNLL